MCSPAHQGHNDLTWFPASSYLRKCSTFWNYDKHRSKKVRELRPFMELTNHFTTRAADGHATPVTRIYMEFILNRAYISIRMLIRTLIKERKIQVMDILSFLVLLCQELVRFFALYRIKPHAPPLVMSLRQFLWVSSLRTYYPGGVFNALAKTSFIKIKDIEHS